MFRTKKHLSRAADVLELVGFRSGKNNIFTVRAPDRITLYILWVIRSGQCRELARLPVINNQDAFDREKQLRKGQFRFRNKNRFIFDRANYKPAVRGYLRKKAEGLLAVFLHVVTPRYDVTGSKKHLFGDFCYNV